MEDDGVEWMPLLRHGESGPAVIYEHDDCFLRAIVGSVAHQTKICSCYGGEGEDPPGMTLREASRMAVKMFEKNNGV